MDTGQISGSNSSAMPNLKAWNYPWVPENWLLLAVGAMTVASYLLSRCGDQKYAHHQGMKLPPGPRNWPIIGAVLAFEPSFRKAFVLHNAFGNLAAKYGPVTYFRLGAQAIVLVSSAEIAEELLKHKDSDFPERSTLVTRLKAKYMGMDSSVMTFSNYDSELKLGRKISMTEFLTVAKLRSYEELRNKEASVMVEKILRQMETIGDHEDGDSKCSREVASSCTTVEIRQAAIDMTQNIIFTLCLGQRFDDLPVTDEIHEFPQLLAEQLKLLMTFNVMEFLPIFEWLDPQGILRALKRFEKRQNGFFRRILDSHRQVLKRNSEEATDGTKRSTRNFMDVLIRFQEEGGQVSDKGLIGIVLTMLMASIHITPSQIEWVLLELARHPKLLQRVRAEIDGVVGTERPVQEADLQALPFLNAVVLETLRLHPVGQSTPPHVNAKPLSLGGYHIPAKTGVIVNIRTIGRDPKAWKDPLQFNPDRFMAVGSSATDPALSSKSASFNGSNFHMLTFGSGRRMCPGYNLAMLLLMRVVATFVHAFDLSPRPGCSPEDLTADEGLAYLLHPDPDLVLTCRPRLARHVYQTTIS